MRQESALLNDRTNDHLTSLPPILDGSPAFEGMEEVFELIAAGLYSLASMLVGEGEQSMRLVEAAIAAAHVSPCTDPQEARQSSRRALGAAALELLASATPAAWPHLRA